MPRNRKQWYFNKYFIVRVKNRFDPTNSKITNTNSILKIQNGEIIWKSIFYTAHFNMIKLIDIYINFKYI